MSNKFRSVLVVVLYLFGQLLTSVTPAWADPTPGVNADGRPLSTVRLGSLAPVVSETGKVSLSVDGVGTLAASALIRFNKPVGATVRSAYLGAASTGFSGFTIPNGALVLNGAGVNWDIITNSSISSVNHWANVTSIVKATIDAAPPGIGTLTVAEGNNTFNIDGEILSVIFDDPNQISNNTVVLLFGAQNVAGDTFKILTAQPINTSDPSLVLDMSLGISFGFQTLGNCFQHSNVDVNSQRLTSEAGGQDDGQDANGALLTVGGIGDSDANPALPFDTSCPLGKRSDDELYNLVPFVTNGDTTITVFTQNPSNDDNIFYSAMFLKATTAIVGEGIVLSPLAAQNPVGTTHTVTATVQDANGAPVVGRTVTFTVLSGPNAGVTGSAVTNASGQASFTYSDTGGAGTDVIQASFVNSAGVTQKSNSVTKIWIAGDKTPPSCALTAVGVDGSGRKFIQITTQDSGSGLGQIIVTSSVNANTSVPPFAVGTTDPVVVTATKIDQTKGATVSLKVIDVAGNVTICDPALVTVTGGAGKAVSQVVTGVAQAESTVSIYNDTPGLRQVDVKVNGKLFKVTRLHDGEVRTIDVAAGLKAGNNNTIVLTPRGSSGSAEVLISDMGKHTAAQHGTKHQVTDRLEQGDSGPLD